MRPSASRSIAVTGTSALALLLSACGGTDNADLDHGKVIDKRHRAAAGPIYAQEQRPAPCRSTRTQTLRTSITRPRPPAPKPAKPAPAKPKPAPAKPDSPRRDAETPRTPDKSNTRPGCGTTTVTVLKGHRTPEKWELKLKDGTETDWETVTREEYHSVDINDHF
ncbi:hypothetical protein SMD44_p10275 (plasmid) [Streptomyces alboflavus]|uniref:Lipoprotein n=1 Tax=Streptomyces alboflavus TaxID=67267 RepID=A0A291W454_9ACTN|nr:hypothetical protein [Streptomyces alboflavus]ATM24774.1 hypothetical protein SMD44_p10275 [Streptomyces alboflavus]